MKSKQQSAEIFIRDAKGNRLKYRAVGTEKIITLAESIRREHAERIESKARIEHSHNTKMTHSRRGLMK